MPQKRILIGGGSGFIGKALKEHFLKRGYAVTLISRSPAMDTLLWDDIKLNGIPEVDAVINLSGANVLFMPWTEARKKELLDSRIKTTEILVDAIKQSSHPPKVFISASAVGIYPVSTEEEFTEDSNAVADDFAGHLVKEWEDTSLPLLNTSTRRVIARIGVVLGDGGMLGAMFLPFTCYLGGVLGSGKQVVPWIHMKDVANIFERVINNNDVAGILNLVAPEIATNETLTKTFARLMNRPAFLPVPAFALRLLLGQKAYLVLEGQKVIPKRILESGFKFQFPDLESALQDIINDKYYSSV